MQWPNGICNYPPCCPGIINIMTAVFYKWYHYIGWGQDMMPPWKHEACYLIIAELSETLTQVHPHFSQADTSITLILPACKTSFFFVLLLFYSMCSCISLP